MVRRLNEGFKAGAKENRMLSKIYSVYNAIEHSNDLRKHGLSLSDYRAFPDVFQQLQNIGYAETFVKSLADFFKKNGFGVSMDDDGVNYVITFDGGVRESKKRPLKKYMKESVDYYEYCVTDEDENILDWFSDEDKAIAYAQREFDSGEYECVTVEMVPMDTDDDGEVYADFDHAEVVWQDCLEDEDFDEDDLEYESIRLKRESTNKRRPKK